MLFNETMISIIIPAYNIEKYIISCLTSISNQTYENLEIIVVDDGSTDSTPDYLDEYAKKDSRVTVIHKDNGGVTSARLRGLKEAHGLWIGFVDGDDWIEPDMYERLLGNAVKYEADISHCGYQMVFPDHTDYYYNTGCLKQLDKKNALKELLNGFIEPSIWNKLFHKTLIASVLKNNLIDSQIRINEDLLMNFYLFRESNNSVYEDICPYHYQIRKGSAATSRLQPYKLSDPIKVCSIITGETQNDQELYPLSIKLLTEKLIRASTVFYSDEKSEIRPCVIEARQQLKSILPAVRQHYGLRSRIRILAEWAAASPSVYRRVHSIYSKVAGSAHKYDVKG